MLNKPLWKPSQTGHYKLSSRSFLGSLVLDPDGPTQPDPTRKPRISATLFGEPNVNMQQGRTRMEEQDFVEVMTRIVMDFRRAKLKRDAVQYAVECVVVRLGHFNGDRVPFHLEAYNEGCRGGDDARVLLSWWW